MTEPLTPMELKILTLMSEGHQYKAMAKILHRHVDTLKIHVTSAVNKLEAKGRINAVAIAIRSNLIP